MLLAEIIVEKSYKKEHILSLNTSLLSQRQLLAVNNMLLDNLKILTEIVDESNCDDGDDGDDTFHNT